MHNLVATINHGCQFLAAFSSSVLAFKRLQNYKKVTHLTSHTADGCARFCKYVCAERKRLLPANGFASKGKTSCHLNTLRNTCTSRCIHTQFFCTCTAAFRSIKYFFFLRKSMTTIS